MTQKKRDEEAKEKFVEEKRRTRRVTMGGGGGRGGQRYRGDQSTGSKSLASTRGARGRQRSMRSRAHGLVHHRRQYITVKTHTS